MQEKNLITSQERALWARERKSASSRTEANTVMAGKWAPWGHCSWKALWGRAWPGRLFTMATGERSLIYGPGGASVPNTLLSFEACSSPPKLVSHRAHHHHLGLRRTGWDVPGGQGKASLIRGRTWASFQLWSSPENALCPFSSRPSALLPFSWPLLAPGLPLSSNHLMCSLWPSGGEIGAQCQPGCLGRKSQPGGVKIQPLLAPAHLIALTFGPLPKEEQ